MRVMVDARQIYRPERRGIGKTMLQLYLTLSRLNPTWDFRLIHQLKFDVPEFSNCPNISHLQLDFPGSHRNNLWENLLLPSAAWLMRCDVLHSPGEHWSSSFACPRCVAFA
jgi:hypothetical protein